MYAGRHASDIRSAVDVLGCSMVMSAPHVERNGVDDRSGSTATTRRSLGRDPAAVLVIA
jgi:hypothetical protein